MGRALVLAILAAFLTLRAALGQSAGPEPKPMVTVGVRVDAPPFAWRTNDGGFSGFLFNLCVDATVRAGYPMQVVPIEVSDRNAFLQGKRTDLDLLCDPITITLERLGALTALAAPQPEFSPIIFVANGSYMTNPEAGAGKLTADEAGKYECLEGPGGRAQGNAAGQTPEKTVYLAAGFVGETTAEGALRTALRPDRLVLKSNERLCLVEKKTHWDAAEDFCNDKLRYYFGDEDIMRSAIRMRTEGGGCLAAAVSLPLSYEPYGLVISGRQQGFRQDFVMALYELFHFEPAEGRFQRSFEGQKMSPYLETLFRTLAIPAGDLNDGARPRAGPAPASE